MPSNQSAQAVGAPPGPQPAQSRRETWLSIARLAWVLVTLLTLVLFLVGIPYVVSDLAQSTDQRALLDLDLTINEFAGYLAALNVVVVLAHILIAAVIVWRCSDEWVALFLAFTLVTNGAVMPLTFQYGRAGLPFAWQFLSQVVVFIGLASSMTLLYVFPNGRFVPRWTALLGASWTGLAFATAFLPDSRLSMSTWSVGVQLLVLLVWSGIGVFAQVFRYWNVSSPIQRQQTKWALLGLVAAGMGPALVILGAGAPASGPEVPNLFYQRVGASFFTFSFLFETFSRSTLQVATVLFPLSFAIAIMRYRLWDIDVIINRTLVYGTLTGILLFLYLVSVLLLSNLFRAVTGQGQFAVVLSTLAIAAIFTPLRRHVQATIDRQFYRRKYDAELALEAFGHMLRDEVDLDNLTEALLDVVQDTMEPAHITCWMRKAET